MKEYIRSNIKSKIVTIPPPIVNVWWRPGLPDVIFANQKSKFRFISDGLGIKNTVIFYDHFIYFYGLVCCTKKNLATLVVTTYVMVLVWPHQNPYWIHQWKRMTTFFRHGQLFKNLTIPSNADNFLFPHYPSCALPRASLFK
jgi:hypothetical protein